MVSRPESDSDPAAVLLHLGDLEQILATDEPRSTAFSRSTARVLRWSRQQRRPKSLTWAFVVERVTRIELAL
ncbi:hypothetical protein [Streptomyces sp. NPDC087525]|uniref:hypothetical protein n=1 Tax=Streptomyces sp. NPDC087525 TaxID=3365793 RepID=UPI003828FCE6